VTKPKPAVYVAVVGLTLKNGDRVEVGETYPGKPAKWLIDQGKVKKRG
jgi:hypothetical protein